MVLHSVTKFINGHADVVGGVLVTRDTNVYDSLRQTMTLTGCCMDPHQAFLAHRGLKTLAVRIDRAQASAAARRQRPQAGRPRREPAAMPGRRFHARTSWAARRRGSAQPSSAQRPVSRSRLRAKAW